MANNSPERWVQRLDNLEKAYSRLDLACGIEDLSDLEMTGLIKTFEIAFELSWKTMKDLLYAEGYDVKSPREAIVQAAGAGVIPDAAVWLEALQSRNTMSHTYDSEAAAEAARIIKSSYARIVADLVTNLVKRRDA